jgi:hypothetical protein
MLQNPKFFTLKFEVELKITILLVLTLKNLLMIICVYKKNMKIFETMKIMEFFKNFMRKTARAGAGPDFLTCRSRSRTKMEWLCNTAFICKHYCPMIASSSAR